MREALAALDTMGTYLVRPHFLALLAEVLLKLGETAEAMTVLDEALAMVESKGERYYEAELYRLKGELLLKQSPASAEECFKRSMAIAESQQARSWQLRTAMSLARLYESRDMLTPIYETFTEGFDTEDLRDASKIKSAFNP
jgi:predicted ATPase